MGVICGNSYKITKRDLNEIIVENDDFSFVYSVYSSLFILNKSKNFILNTNQKIIYILEKL